MWREEMYRHTESKITPEMEPWEILNLGNLSRPVFLEQLARMDAMVEFTEEGLRSLVERGASIRQVITMINHSERSVDEDLYRRLNDLEFANYMRANNELDRN
jgi:hypothetical protein